MEQDISVTIILCNNNAYGAIRAGQDRNYNGRRFGSDLVNPNFLKLAEAYNIPAVRADNLKDFEVSLNKSIASNKLNLIELTLNLMDP